MDLISPIKDLLYSNYSGLQIVGYMDTNSTSFTNNRKLHQEGYIRVYVILGCNVMSYNSKKQFVVKYKRTQDYSYDNLRAYLAQTGDG